MLCTYSFFFIDIRRRLLRSTLFPYTTLFRSADQPMEAGAQTDELGRDLQTAQGVSLMAGSPHGESAGVFLQALGETASDRKSTRLNSSHVSISYAVFCLKKKKEQKTQRL